MVKLKLVPKPNEPINPPDTIEELQRLLDKYQSRLDSGQLVSPELTATTHAVCYYTCLITEKAERSEAGKTSGKTRRAAADRVYSEIKEKYRRYLYNGKSPAEARSILVNAYSRRKVRAALDN